MVSHSWNIFCCCCCCFCWCCCCCCWLLLSLLIPETHPESLIKIGSVTAEILLTLSSRWVGGGWWWWWCKVIFVSHPTFQLSCGWVGVVTIGEQLYQLHSQFWSNLMNHVGIRRWSRLKPSLVHYSKYIPSLLFVRSLEKPPTTSLVSIMYFFIFTWLNPMTRMINVFIMFSPAIYKHNT